MLFAGIADMFRKRRTDQNRIKERLLKVERRLGTEIPDRRVFTIMANTLRSAKKGSFSGCWARILVGWANIMDVVWVVRSVTQSIGRGT